MEGGGSRKRRSAENANIFISTYVQRTCRWCLRVPSIAHNLQPFAVCWFVVVCQATGVSDVNEVIQKMISQESTAENLMVLTKENQVTKTKKNLRFAVAAYISHAHRVKPELCFFLAYHRITPTDLPLRERV